jgi:hypothetical protein
MDEQDQKDCRALAEYIIAVKGNVSPLNAKMDLIVLADAVLRLLKGYER